jgi:hypothetical protein
VHKKQEVADVTEEVLARQATTRAEHTGESFGQAMRTVLDTEAGEQLRELGDGPHRHERAEDWQASVARERAVEQAVALGAPPADDREQELPA